MPRRTAPHNQVLSLPQVRTSSSNTRTLMYQLPGLSRKEMQLVKSAMARHKDVVRCSLSTRRSCLFVTTKVSVRQRGNTAKLRDLLHELNEAATAKLTNSRKQAKPAKKRPRNTFRRAPHQLQAGIQTR